MSIKLKRAYDEPTARDGQRYLVERLWPRGVSKEEARLDGWFKDLAPSKELRQWYGHDPRRWGAFQRRYGEELRAPEKRTQLRELATAARAKTVTFVYAAKDEEHNNAVVLKEVVQEVGARAGR